MLTQLTRLQIQFERTKLDALLRILREPLH
jgi:hypothetical protein